MEIKDQAIKIFNDVQMYADMSEDEFWATSSISPQEAQKRADYYGEFLNKLAEVCKWK